MRGDPEPISNQQASDEALVCFFCGLDVGLERGRTRYGQVIVRCRDVLACDRRLREQPRTGYVGGGPRD